MNYRKLRPGTLIPFLHRREAGQALVELAFTMPVLLLMLLGAIEFGQATYAAIEVSNAAKAAVQYAAMNGGAYYDSAGMTAAAQADGYDLNTLLGTTITATAATPTCSCSLSTDTCTVNAAPAPPTGCTNSHLFVTVNVTTTATFTPIVHFPGLPTSFALTGSDTQEVIP